jgi:hypothetical protein
MFLFMSVETSLATNIKQCFQSGPVVVCEARRSGRRRYVATFANILVYSIVGGAVSYAVIKLTTELGGAVIAFVERLFS